MSQRPANDRNKDLHGFFRVMGLFLLICFATGLVIPLSRYTGGLAWIVVVAFFLAVLSPAILRLQMAGMRYIGSAYAVKNRPPAHATKWIEAALFAPHPNMFLNKGTPVVVRVHDHGISIGPLYPWAWVAPTLFLPFDEMQLRTGRYSLWGEDYVLRMARLPNDAVIVLRPALVLWIRRHTRAFPDVTR